MNGGIKRAAGRELTYDFMKEIEHGALVVIVSHPILLILATAISVGQWRSGSKKARSPNSLSERMNEGH